MLEKRDRSQNAPLVMAFCFDANMIVGARLLLASIVATHRGCNRPVALHAVTSILLSSADLHSGDLPSHITLQLHEAPQSLFEDVKLGSWLTSATFMRLGLADLLTDEKVLYLDCDTLVRRELAKLFDVELGDKLLASVPDAILTRNHSDFRVTYGDMDLRPRSYVQQVCNVMDFEGYFNAGVMLLNLRQWREEGTAAALTELIVQRQSLFFGDQDALNAVVQDRYIKLDPRWNAISYALFAEPPDTSGDPEWAEIVEAWRADPWIIHFVGLTKPWLPNVRKTIFHDEAQRYLSASFQRSSLLAQPRQLGLPPPQAIDLPLVSVIVVNYNYSLFLRKCVSSILLQEYPHLECIVVDNSSSDDFEAVIASLQSEFTSLKVLRRKNNGGQGVAWQDGYARVSGKYVMFVDADDFLLQHAIAYHVWTHLRLPQSTGFTSSDMIQVEDDQIVLGTYFEAAFRRHCKEVALIDADSLRNLSQALQASKQFPHLSVGGDHARLLNVRRDTLSWVWSPTSANMYRKDALSLFIHAPALATFVSNADTFMNIAINAFVGSVLIDKPLSAYRLHSRNNFSTGPSLNNFANYAKSNDAASRSALLIVEYVLDNLKDFERRCLSPLILFKALNLLKRRAADYPGKWQAAVQLYIAVNRWLIRRSLKNLRKTGGYAA